MKVEKTCTDLNILNKNEGCSAKPEQSDQKTSFSARTQRLDIKEMIIKKRFSLPHNPIPRKMKETMAL